MKKRVMSASGSLGLVVLVLILQSCGGGGGGPAIPLPGAGPGPVATPTFSVLSATESAAVSDGPVPSTGVDPYAVEFNGVLEATVVTTDGTPRLDASGVNCDTFARINDYPASYDPLLQAYCSPAPEIKAHLVLAGTLGNAGYLDDALTTNATFRLRGSSSRGARQKSYRVKLASGRPLWRGETTLQLNKHPYDLTRMRNKLAMDLFRDIPHMGSLRTQFVHMSITNKNAANVQYASADFGLFTHVEKFGKEFLSNRGLPSASTTIGNIYKAEDFDFSMGARNKLALALDANYTVMSASKASFETVLSLEADNNDHRPLINMIDDVNNVAIPFDVTFDKYFDKANYLTWLATSILMGNRDTINQNFALYQPKDGSKFFFLPWDYDGAFGFEDQPNEAAAVNALYASWQKTAANWWGVPLHQRFMQDPKHLAELKLAVTEIYNAYLTQAKIRSKTDRYKTLIASSVAATPDVTQLPVFGTTDSAAAQWARESDRLADAVATNAGNFVAALESPMPYWQSAQVVATSTGQKIQLNWDQSVDLQGDAVTYTVQVANSPSMASPVLNVSVAQQGNDFPSYEIPMLANGVYYLKVAARDSKGNTQSAFDYVDLGSNRYFGVRAFTVTNGVVTQ